MDRVRPPAVAGVFYPADPAALLTRVRRLLEDVRVPEPVAAKALIVPHAGFPYSGPVAASAYARIAGRRDLRTVVLVGPAHYARGPGLALSSATAFSSPLGKLPVDREGTARLLELPRARVRDGAHAPEHCLEVQLPFVQALLADVSIVPILVGDDSAAAVAEALETIWGGRDTLVIVSSDLSHYLDHDSARARDRATATAVEALDEDAIPERGACGLAAIGGLLRVARHRGLRARTLDLRNSGDTAGGRDRVVGYGAFMLAEPG